jgi:hypothetical protein
MKPEHEAKRIPSSTTNNNKNDIKVHNHFNLTINFGDSINVLALIAGIYIMKKWTKRNLLKKKLAENE